MKKTIWLILSLITVLAGYGQNKNDSLKPKHTQQKIDAENIADMTQLASVKYADSLKLKLNNAKQDTDKVNQLILLCGYYTYKYTDTALIYGRQSLSLAQRIGFQTGEIRALNMYGQALTIRGNYAGALSVELRSLRIAENLGNDALEYQCLLSSR